MSTRKLPLLLAATICVCGCQLLETAGPSAPEQDDAPATLSLKFLDGFESVKAPGVQLPDTNSFILSISNSDGDCIYYGLYCDCTPSLTVEPGTYHIRVVSEEFRRPDFESPQWGDEQTVRVSGGERCLIELLCRQMNCGVRINIDKAFLTDYSSNSSLLLSSIEGSLLYSYSEKRTAFFVPGVVKLVLSSGSEDKTLLSRSLCSGEILCLSLKLSPGQSSSSPGGFLLQIDTTRTYISEEYLLEAEGSSSGKGDSVDNALTVGEAASKVGSKGVWVGGYIVGGDLSSKGANYEGPFKADSNLLLGPRSIATSREGCISVQLPSGKVRDEVNLVRHGEHLGRYIYLKGDIESPYFGLTGLKNVTEYKFK